MIRNEKWVVDDVHYVIRNVSGRGLVCACADYTLAPSIAALPQLLAAAEDLLEAYREDHAALVEACTLHGVLGTAEPPELAYIGKMAERIERAEQAIAAARGTA